MNLLAAARGAIYDGANLGNQGAAVKFAALIEYLQDKKRIEEVRPVHRQHLAGLRDKGLLAISGPFTDDSGALIVYEARSAEEAEGLLRGDPFHAQGIFLKWVIRPWNPVLANRDLLPG
jgi:hypothetical protein